MTLASSWKFETSVTVHIFNIVIINIIIIFIAAHMNSGTVKPV